MGGIALAWAVGEGILVFRSVKYNHAPPVPGALLATSGLFILLALLAQADRARFLATALAWGFDAAAFMNLFPAVTTGGTAAPSKVLPPVGRTAPIGDKTA